MITFLLNQQQCRVSNVDPNTSILDYLREHLHKTGTKEGCASGDCGACTVVLGEASDEGMQYKSINACITPIGSLHGKQLLTVEDLKDGDQLHPAQQAMVDCHGSQCGFCTPGFVMSMFAYRKNNQQPDRESINEALGGNLCRCTGYRPIVDAAVQMFEPAGADQFDQTEAAVTTSLNAINQDSSTVELQANGNTFFAPATVQELTDLLQQYPQARLVAGGTDLSLEITQFLRSFEVLISTARVAELTEFTLTENALDIGAAVTYSQVKHELVALYPDLQELIDRLGSRQIRNQGTIGGNVGNASPIGDMPPVLIALGATLVLRKGEARREIPVADYFVSYKVTVQQPGEFIERIIVPRPVEGDLFRVYKISKRLEDDISSTCGAFKVQLEQGVVKNICIAFGGMAEIPKRANHCEQALLNQPFTQATINKAMNALAKDFTPISDFRASADYRLRVSQNLLRRLHLELQSADGKVSGAQASDVQPADTLRVTHYA